MSTSLARLAAAAAALTLVVATAACDDSVNPEGDGHISLVIRPDPGALPAGASGVRVQSGANVVVLEEITTTWTRFTAGGAFNTKDWTVLGETRTVRTNLSSGTDFAYHTLTVLTPAGNYDRFRGRITDVRVTGTYNGAPFDATYPVNGEFQSIWKSNWHLTRGDTLYVTLPIDPRSWFLTGGALVNPSSTDTAVRAAIAARILASLQAFEDDDQNGTDET